MTSEAPPLCEILVRLLSGEIDSESAQEQIEALSMEEFGEVYGNLHHYYSDEDIRQRDPEYKKFQDAELKKLIDHIRTGNIKAAQEVSFLHVSKGI